MRCLPPLHLHRPRTERRQASIEETLRGIRPYYKAKSADQDGGFSIRGVPPGNYTLFAWDVVDTSAYYNRDFIRPYESRGVPVVIEPKAESVMRVKVIENEN